MKLRLLRATSNDLFFNYDSVETCDFVPKNEICLALPLKPSTSNCVVVLCRYGIREILCPIKDNRWEEL